MTSLRDAGKAEDPKLDPALLVAAFCRICNLSLFQDPTR